MTRAETRVFVVSALALFLELALIRWLPAHVLFLSYFANIILLGSFLGLSAGCLAAGRAGSFLRWTPLALVATLAAGHGAETLRSQIETFVDVGRQSAPQVAFWGAEFRFRDGSFAVPMELIAAAFFILSAVVMAGPGQELGRSLREVKDRAKGYGSNLAGSAAGIALFALCSTLSMRPWAWFLLIALGVWWLMQEKRTGLDFTAALVAMIALASMTSGPAWMKWGKVVGEHLWSPYYRIDYDAGQQSIFVNQLPHQQMLAASVDVPEYQIPHLLRRDSGGAPFKDVLIIGAGSGNDAAWALRWGAEHVDAVEIDPMIAELGRRHHPERPYHDPRVNVIINDGRRVLKTSEKRYDAVIYALVDSAIVHGSQANLRLESYLFTREALSDAARLVKPGGALILYNFYRQGWIVTRLASTLYEVTGTTPVVLNIPYKETIEPGPVNGFSIMMAGEVAPIHAAFAKHKTYRLKSGVAAGPQSPNGFALSKKISARDFGPSTLPSIPGLEPATDDWPFLYMRGRVFPAIYAKTAAIILLLSALGVWLAAGKGARLTARGARPATMFLMGAGFMLLETKAVVQLALLFGSRWNVNAAVFFCVLLLAWLANAFVMLRRGRDLKPYWLGLAAALVVGYALSPALLLHLPGGLSVAAGCLAALAPVLFTGVVFSTLFSASSEPEISLAWNTLGALAGGVLESASMLVGFRGLALVALAIYAVAFAASTRESGA